MIINLNAMEINTDRVSTTIIVGKCHLRIYFITGNSILVRCFRENPDKHLIAYSGSPEALKAKIEGELP